MSARAARPALLPSRVAVLGFARSGRALTGALLDRGVEVAVADDKPASAFVGLSALEARGARFYLGEGSDPLRGSDPILDGAGWLALSPGVPTRHPLVVAARRRGVPVLSELEIAWRIAEEETEGRNRWVAVTGTNGKSTTTAWIAAILGRGERPVALAGNIGAPLSGFLGNNTPRDFVCEVSSFQLEAVERFRPDVAVLTNVTPDHLDRYARTSAKATSRSSTPTTPSRAARLPARAASRSPAGDPRRAGRGTKKDFSSPRSVESAAR
jgi:UDP-N-acetylmuramoylalanine--D-glutamate ligase